MYTFSTGEILKEASKVASLYSDGIWKDCKRVYKFTHKQLADGLSIDNHHNEFNLQIIAKGLEL